MRAFRHPLGQVVIVLLAAYVVFEFGLWLVPPLIGMSSAPVPNSVLLQYMATVLVAVLLYVSSQEQRWREFKQPIEETMVAPERRVLRAALLVALPLVVGAFVFLSVRPTVAAPPALRSIHPAPPSSITFRGRTLTLATLENPLRRGNVEEAYLRGREIYTKNCMPCHGDALSGDGYFAHGFNPTPIDLTDVGTISQLSESYVFWRVAKGGPGLPREGAPWNSAMPVWENFLTEDEIWAVVLFLYEQTGAHPRVMTEGGEH
jgi:mono/diheme cytochrome c family protein